MFRAIQLSSNSQHLINRVYSTLALINTMIDFKAMPTITTRFDHMWTFRVQPLLHQKLASNYYKQTPLTAHGAYSCGISPSTINRLPSTNNKCCECCVDCRNTQGDSSVTIGPPHEQQRHTIYILTFLCNSSNQHQCNASINCNFEEWSKLSYALKLRQ